MAFIAVGSDGELLDHPILGLDLAARPKNSWGGLYHSSKVGAALCSAFSTGG